ncbi:StbB family protein [Vibrio cholerae]|uniref:StbB family protein n=1 Tax=Vibrio cholerae TaxID=666 RepID=UPI003D3573C9
MYLKIAIMNNSGNVGKSMICDNLLRTRIPNADVVKIETINSDGTMDATVAAKNIKQVFDRIDESDISLIDVGASNIETFMDNLVKLNGAHEDIDFYIIPTTPRPKQQVDTIKTIERLLDMGVDADNIRVIFNFYDPDVSVKELYPVIFESDLVKELGLNKIQNQFTITENPVFDMLAEIGYSFIEIANDERDFKALIRATENKEERSTLSHLRSAQRLAQGFIKELDSTFNKLMKSCNIKIEKADKVEVSNA